MLNMPLKIRIIERYQTQADFAQEIGIDDSLVSKVVRGRRSLSEEDQIKWANALGHKVEDIFPEAK